MSRQEHLVPIEADAIAAYERLYNARQNACHKCAKFLSEHPSLIGACASVGIEHGMSTKETLQSYMAKVHRRENH